MRGHRLRLGGSHVRTARSTSAGVALTGQSSNKDKRQIPVSECAGSNPIPARGDILHMTDPSTVTAFLRVCIDDDEKVASDGA